MTKYDAHGTEAEFEPQSGGLVLRNMQGISRVEDMDVAESEALEAALLWALSRYSATHSFTANDVCELHQQWLGKIYSWAGAYRNVNIAKGGFMFAASSQIPRLMTDFERTYLSKHTPCNDMSVDALARALAITHAELIIIHPFREGNGRSARLLSTLMAMQAGWPTLDVAPLDGRYKQAYILAIHAAFRGNYEPLVARFLAVMRRTAKRAK